MMKAFDFGKKLARTLQVDVVGTQSEWHAHVRRLFRDVNAAELMRFAQNRNSNLYAALVNGQSSSMYAIPLRPDANYTGNMMDFGLLRDPERFGDPRAEVGGLLLGCSEGCERPFNELIGIYGIDAGATFNLCGGTAIDLQGRVSNSDLCNLARLIVVELIAAFDMTGQEWAQHDRSALEQAIHSGYISKKWPPL